MRAIITVSQNGTVINKDIPIELPPHFSNAQFARFRPLEINRLIAEGFTAALDRFNVDDPISNDTIIMISFDGLPTRERKDNAG